MTIADELATLPHFHGLPADLLEALARGTRRRELAARETVFRAGGPAEAFYAVRRGVVRLYRAAADGHEQTVQHVRAPNTFAEAAVLKLGHYPVSAEAAASPTELLELRARPFLELFARDERLATGMVGSLCMRLLQLVERVDELSVSSAAARAARYLLRLPSRLEDGAAVVALPLAKKDLAAHLSMTPETLSRLLRRWHDDGWVESRKGAVVLRDVERLLAVADRQEPPAGE